MLRLSTGLSIFDLRFVESNHGKNKSQSGTACRGTTVGVFCVQITCGVCESGLGGREKSRGNGVFMLACTPGKFLETGVRYSDRAVYCSI
jgi:hypothetical protein